MQISHPFHRFVIFKIHLSYFLFAPNDVPQDDYNRSSDIKFGNAFAVHTIHLLTTTICCVRKNVYDKSKKID